GRRLRPGIHRPQADLSCRRASRQPFAVWTEGHFTKTSDRQVFHALARCLPYFRPSRITETGGDDPFAIGTDGHRACVRMHELNEWAGLPFVPDDGTPPVPAGDDSAVRASGHSVVSRRYGELLNGAEADK